MSNDKIQSNAECEVGNAELNPHSAIRTPNSGYLSFGIYLEFELWNLGFTP